MRSFHIWNRIRKLFEMKAAIQFEVSVGDAGVAHRSAVERVIREMRGRLADPLSLPEMARIAGLSPFHFDRIFHEITGIPAVQFLYALRIEAAKRLLLTTTLTVTDVCYEVGYNSLGTFTRRFTKLVGLPPSQFRSLAQNLSPSILESWAHTEGAVNSSDSCISGQLISPSVFSGMIFVGLFRTAIPQSTPISGILLTAPGPFHIGPLADGRYYLFAAAFPYTPNLLTYMLPEPNSLFVGSGGQPATVRNGKSDRVFEVRLRELCTTDPPILISLPFLLAGRSRAMRQQ